MTMVKSVGVPELAGLGSYRDAARIGLGVDESVRRLLRYQWTARRAMMTLVAHLPSTPTWEIKGAMALHQWLLAEHVDSLRARVGEMRHPVPELNAAPDPALDAWCEELLRAESEVELVAGVYGVAIPALLAAVDGHLATTNLLVDHPTRRVLRFMALELGEIAEWGATTLAAVRRRGAPEAAEATAWVDHLGRYLARAGGIAGPAPDAAEAPPPARATGPFVPDLHPRRDERFRGQYNFVFAAQDLYTDTSLPADERNLALLCKRTLEMDVAEMMASVMVERPDLPWEFHHDYARQLWDELRHAMMGSVAFEARGVDWTRIPLNVGFSLRLNLHATPLERQTMLFGIEQSLMPATTGKRYEYEVAREAGDELSAHFQDYDWADEVLHAQIGRRWLKREGIGGDEAVARAGEIHGRTWAALDAYRDREPQVDWWDDLCRAVLGKPSADRSSHDGRPRVTSA
ncbi:MAG: hypothetical protein R2909_18180 [Gemmatimonadales bacterium]